MLAEEHKEQIQSLYRQWLADNDYRPRTSQREMVAFIARQLGEVEDNDDGVRMQPGCSHIGIVEAGTGTGKTLAYLLPAIVLAKSLNKKLVVSTATISLQEQLLNKDIPELSAVFDSQGLSFSVALAKGRGRYLCLSKLERHLDSQRDGAPLFPDEELVSRSQMAALTEFRDNYQHFLDGDSSGESAAWNGDSDEYADEVDDSVFRLVAADGASCNGRRCENFSRCALFKARDKINSADVIVANHDLVLANVVMESGLLPDAEQSIYVFDEAHHLPDKCRSRYTLAVSIQAELSHLKRSGLLLKRLQTFSALPVSEIKSVEKQLKVVDEALVLNTQSLIQHLDARFSEQESDVFRFPMGIPDEQLCVLVSELKDCYQARISYLEKLDKLVGDYRSLVEVTQQPLLEAAIMQLSLLKDATEKSCSLYGDYAQANQPRSSEVDDSAEGTLTLPSARWVAQNDAGGVLLFSAPISCAAQLNTALWSNCYAAVLTSATLATNQGFGEFLEDVGCDATTQTLNLAGAINYRQGILHVPRMQFDPGSVQGHTDEVIRLLPELLPSDTGSLVLFSSRKQMEEVYEALSVKFDGRMLVQGKLSKNALISRHKELVDDGVGGVIFGLASLSEGLDLKGDYCTQLVIAKLPFSPPDSPIEEALGEWLESKGQNPFSKVTLPKAMIRLRQSCGRLLRTEMDTGRISLLDKRILSRHYGKAFLSALPPFARQFD